MQYHYQWSELSGNSNASEYIARRILDSSNYDIFITKNSNNIFGLLIEVKNDYSRSLRKKNLNVDALKIDFSKGRNDFLFTVELLNTDDLSMFDYFIYYLLSDINNYENETQLIQHLMDNFKKWQRFLSASSKGLGETAIRGLMAELFQLYKWIQEYPEHTDKIINCWYGPDKLQHDFIFDNLSIEIKSIGSTDKRKITISSEHQLESFSEHLYLYVFKVIKTEQLTSSALNLNQLVESIKALLIGESLSIFEEKLLMAQYIKRKEYDENNFIITPLQNYQVIKDFPRITTHNLPLGISNINYEIDFKAIEQFKMTSPIIII